MKYASLLPAPSQSISELCQINDLLQVSIVLPSGAGNAPRVEVINRPQNEPRIEKLLVARVVQIHADFMGRGRVA